VVLLHVVDVRVEEALHGAYGGLLGRHRCGRDPGDTIGQAAAGAGADLLAAASARLGRPTRHDIREGLVEREVVAACEGAALLVCARAETTAGSDPKASVATPGSSSTMHPAPCCSSGRTRCRA
jgi:hypothetical protein